MEHSANPTPKNLVICCDGTDNEILQNISNVPTLHRRLGKTDPHSVSESVDIC